MKQLKLAENFPGISRIFWYELTVKDGSGSALTSAYRVYVDYNVYYRHWDFNHFNSLGGLDGARIRGSVEKTFEITSEMKLRGSRTMKSSMHTILKAS